MTQSDARTGDDVCEPSFVPAGPSTFDSNYLESSYNPETAPENVRLLRCLETAEECFGCTGTIDELVVRERVYLRGATRRVVAPLCTRCAPRTATDAPVACEGGCGRFVINRFVRQRRHTFCSARCGRRYYSAVAQQRQRDARDRRTLSAREAGDDPVPARPIARPPDSEDVRS